MVQYLLSTVTTASGGNIDLRLVHDGVGKEVGGFLEARQLGAKIYLNLFRKLGIQVCCQPHPDYIEDHESLIDSHCQFHERFIIDFHSDFPLAQPHGKEIYSLKCVALMP